MPDGERFTDAYSSNFPFYLSSFASYHLNVGGVIEKGGVRPDIPVKAFIDDYMGNGDPEMSYVKTYIQLKQAEAERNKK